MPFVASLLVLMASSAPTPAARQVAYYQSSSSETPIGAFWETVPIKSSNSTQLGLGTTNPAATYNETFVRSFVHFSQVAYCQREEIEQWSDSATSMTADNALAITGGVAAESVVVVTNSTTDTQAYIAYFRDGADGNVVVAFRGSQSVQNWITNLQFSKVNAYPHCDGCETHDGFLKAWQSVLPSVTATVSDLLQSHPTAAVYITGHSLGAALAVLCGAHLSLVENLPVTGVHTFGEPRVGNVQFAQFFQQGKFESRRITHYKDPVPHLPMTSLGFTHVPTEVWYNENSDSYTICDGSGKDASCSNSAAWDSLLYVNDHLTYIGLAISSC